MSAKEERTAVLTRTLMLAAGGALAIGLFASGNSGPEFRGPVAFVIGWVLMTMLLYPFLLVFVVFRGKGPFGTWPRWREFQDGTNAYGLPVVRWRERSMFLPPHEVSVEPGAGGQWVLTFTRPKIVDTGGNLLPWMIFGFLAPVAKGLSKTIRDGGETSRWAWDTLTAI